MSDYAFEEPELTDEQLDAVLHAAGKDLLAHVSATGDPAGALLALMEQGTMTSAQSDPAPDQAVAVIEARVQTEAFLRTLDQTIPAINAYRSAAAAPRYVEVIERDGKQTATLIEVLADRDRALGLTRELTCALNTDIESVRALESDLNRVGGLDLGLDISLALHLARGFALELAVDLEQARDVGLTQTHASGLERALAQARDGAVKLVRVVAVVRARARARIRDLQAVARLLPDAAVLRMCGVDVTLSAALGPDWDPLTADLQAVERVTQILHSVLMAIRIDASDTDLSRLNLDGESRNALSGVVWTANTRWPEALRTFVEQNSLRIGDGIYQVRPGADHDSAGIAVLA